MDFWRSKDWKIASMGRVWFILSAVMIGAGLTAWTVRGLNYGIDFTGGSLYKYTIVRELGAGTVDAVRLTGQVRELVSGMGIARAQIQVSGDNLILVRTAVSDQAEADQESAQLLEELNAAVGAQVGRIELAGADLVGPVVGRQLRMSAIRALIVGSLLILIYLTIRYEFRTATVCIAALVHDVLVMVGAMALLQVELNTEFVAAILTVVGFSANDSVVIFDRIRENRRLHRGADLESVANASLLQTMPRSINTSLTVIFTLLALFFLGGSTIHPFILALLVGMVGGMYSSIFFAAPLLIRWDRWSRQRRGEYVASRRRTPAVAGTSGGAEAPAAPMAAEEAGTGSPSVSAEQVLRRAQDAAQEEKREARRERRQKKGGRGKRRH